MAACWRRPCFNASTSASASSGTSPDGKYRDKLAERRAATTASSRVRRPRATVMAMTSVVSATSDSLTALCPGPNIASRVAPKASVGASDA